MIDPEDRSLTHASIGTTDKSVSAIAGQWFEVVRTEPITLYEKDTIKTQKVTANTSPFSLNLRRLLLHLAG